jgi:hypothetical protein
MSELPDADNPEQSEEERRRVVVGSGVFWCLTTLAQISRAPECETLLIAQAQDPPWNVDISPGQFRPRSFTKCKVACS